MDWTFYLFWSMIVVLIALSIVIGSGGGSIRKTMDQLADYWNYADRKKINNLPHK